MTPLQRFGSIGLVAAALALTACGSGDDLELNLSPEAERGHSLARTKGCAACHGRSGGGGVGPAWVGLWESEVLLDDGTTVTADAEYIRESIIDPGAQRVEGYSLQMPGSNLSDDEIVAIIAFIEELGGSQGNTP